MLLQSCRRATEAECGRVGLGQWISPHGSSLVILGRGSEEFSNLTLSSPRSRLSVRHDVLAKTVFLSLISVSQAVIAGARIGSTSLHVLGEGARRTYKS